MEIKLETTEAEIDLIKNSAMYGVGPVPPKEVSVAATKTGVIESLKKIEVGKPTEEVVAEDVVAADDAPKETAAKVEPPVAEVKVIEPTLDLSKITITKDYVDGMETAINDLKNKLGDAFTEDMDEKLGKYMISDNLKKLVAGGYNAKQAATILALQAQGFVSDADETKNLIQKKIERVRNGANLKPAPPMSTETVSTESDLIHKFQHGRTSQERNNALNAMLNGEEDAKLVKRSHR